MHPATYVYARWSAGDANSSPAPNLPFDLGIYCDQWCLHNCRYENPPSDYRNGAQWYDIDVSKWFIWLWEKTGLASHVNRITVCEIEEARNGGAESSGENDVKLPVMEWEHYIEAVKEGQDLVVIAGFVHDVKGFVDQHPGGASLINQARGKDATSMFHGGTYDHSSHAHNVLRKLRFAVIRGGGESEIKYELMDHKFVLLR